MKRIAAALVLVVSIGIIRITAQVNPIEVTIPLSGQFVVRGNLISEPVRRDYKELLLLDTSKLTIEKIAQGELLLTSPIFNNTGNKIAYIEDNATNLLHLPERTKELIIDQVQVYPKSWSPDQATLAFVKPDYESDPVTTTVGTFSLPTRVFTTLFVFQQNQILDQFYVNPDLVEENPIKFRDIHEVQWNPVFSDWILLQILATTEISTEDRDLGVPITFLHNLQTGQQISIDTLFDNFISLNSISWSPNGRAILLSVSRYGYGADTAIVAFDPNNATTPLEVVAQADTGNDVVSEWLGVGNLFLMWQSSSVSNEDWVFLIAEIIDDQYYSTEFLRLPSTTFSSVGDVDWHITASEEEKRQISCIFDQTLSAQLRLNTTGRVTLGGTASRLLADHFTDANILTQMPPATSFTVVGNPYCQNGYRWWQVQLGDGTTGWAAEATTTEYFLEPSS